MTLPLPAPELRPAEKRELDREVAEALGWTGLKDSGVEWWGTSPAGTPYCDLNRYSEDMGAAWECVTWLRERGWVVQVWSFPGGWADCIVTHQDGGTGTHQRRDTEAEAIVTAFLETLRQFPELRGQGHE